MEEKKDLFKSKTFWANALGIAMVIATIFGIKPNADLIATLLKVYASLLPVINVLLRLVTKEEVVSVGGISLKD